MDDQLMPLFPDGPGGRTLSVPLPPGRVIVPEGASRPTCWLSDEPVADGLWSALRDEHGASGLWPLLACADDGPWPVGEADPRWMSAPAAHDPATVLRSWWQEVGADPDVVDSLAPFRAFPGLAPGRPVDAGMADETANITASLQLDLDELVLLLVPAGSGAEALAVAGWTGPTNHDNDTGRLAAVLASWERRFGGQVVRVDFDRLWMTVAEAPGTYEEALAIAAEHVAFCPDNVWQSEHETLDAYARSLVDRPVWSFWWD